MGRGRGAPYRPSQRRPVAEGRAELPQETRTALADVRRAVHAFNATPLDTPADTVEADWAMLAMRSAGFRYVGHTGPWT